MYAVVNLHRKATEKESTMSWLMDLTPKACRKNSISVTENRPVC